MKNIKKRILFLVFLHNSISPSNHYKDIICLSRKKNNFLLTVGVLSIIGTVYAIANSTNKKILRGEAFTGIFQSCNLYRDRIFNANEWIKKFILPFAGYLTIGNFFNKNNSINFKDQRIGKLIKIRNQELCMGQINKQLDSIVTYNSWESSSLVRWITTKPLLFDIYRFIGIEKLHKYFNIAHHKDHLSMKSIEYYDAISQMEDAIENFDLHKSWLVLNGEESYGDVRRVHELAQYQLISQSINKELYHDFKKKMIAFGLGGIMLGVFFIYLYYKCDLAKKYIEKNGLGNGDFLTEFLHKNQWWGIKKVICCHVDKLYSSLGIMQYILLPISYLIFCNKFLQYKYDNQLSYNLNIVFSLNFKFFDFWTQDKAIQDCRVLWGDYTNNKRAVLLKIKQLINEKKSQEGDKDLVGNINNILDREKVKEDPADMSSDLAAKTDGYDESFMMAAFVERIFNLQSLPDLSEFLYCDKANDE
jgi:hypothetical protein